MTAKGILVTVAFLLFLIASCSLCGPESRAQSAGGAAPELRVTISTKQTKVRPGEVLLLRAEIFNEGNDTVFVGKELDGADNALSLLRLNVFRFNGKPIDGLGAASAADYARYRDDRKPPLATQFSKYLDRIVARELLWRRANPESALFRGPSSRQVHS